MEDPLRATLTPDVVVIETFGWTGSAFLRLERHLRRMEATCGRLGFRYSGDDVKRALALVGGGPKRVRLTCDAGGAIALNMQDMPPNPAFWKAVISDERLDAHDPWLQVKTSRRERYDRVRTALPTGVQEAIFLNRQGQVCEGTVTNIFADLGQGLVTPPLACGLLPGVLREEMLDQGRCREQVLTVSDLKGARLLLAGNSLRGLIRLKLN